MAKGWNAATLVAGSLGIGLALFSTSAAAVKLGEHWDFGGAARLRFDQAPSRDIHKTGLDTVMFSLQYDSDSWIGAARYRFYGGDYPYQYVGYGKVQFPEYAWIGYRFGEGRELQLGLNQVPFGLMPYYSSTFYETLGNPLGMEDTWEVGAKYSQKTEHWQWQAAYYVKPPWPGMGTSKGDTYANVVTPADPSVVNGSNNQERHAIALRVAREFQADGWQHELGASLYRSELRNSDTGGSGHRLMYAVHYAGQHGPWQIKAQAARLQMTPKNPGDRRLVSFGSYDGTFNIAARGNFYTGDLSYTFPQAFAGGWITGVRPYVSYSRFDKSSPGFKASQRFFLGTSWSVKAFYMALEWIHGRNDLAIGGSSYTQSLGAGGIDSWHSQLYMNIGYYW